MSSAHSVRGREASPRRSEYVTGGGRRRKGLVALCVFLIAVGCVGAVGCDSGTATTLGDNPTAVSVVQDHLAALKNNDYDRWLSTLSKERRESFSKQADRDFHIVSLTVNDVHEELDESYKTSVLRSDKARAMGLSAENVSVVAASFTAEYNHEKSPENDGERDWHYILIRDDESSPWLIQAWGWGKGGI